MFGHSPDPFSRDKHNGNKNAEVERTMHKNHNKMKKALLIALALCTGFVANAQITTGESSAQVIRTGNRAEAGDFGLYLGGTASMFKNLVNIDNAEFEALPLINFKYMVNDNVEARLGLEWWTSATINKSDVESTSYDYESKNKVKETTKMLYPGFAYHFSNNNLLDVYVGAELPLGWGGNSTYTFVDQNGTEGDVDNKTRVNTFKLGLGGFVGLQAYVANLPLAVGVEYGVSSLNDVVSSKIVEEEGQKFESKTSDRDWTVGHQVRLTLTYFFKM